MSEERVVQLVALVVAELIVGAGWLVILGFALFLVNRHVSRTAPPGSRMEPWGWLVGIASFCFWPAAIVLGVIFLRDPKTVRVGRACVVGGLMNVSAAVVIALVVTAVLYLQFPEYLPR